MADSVPIRIPLADVELGQPEIEAVTKVLRSGWLTAGATVAHFEQQLAKMCGDGTHVFAVANCTAGLHLAYLALGLGPGDEVLVPTLTFVAAANMVRAVGATPVFVDCTGEHDLNLDPADVEGRITPKTRAITVVHFGGYACDMDAILAIAKRHELPVIEDCAHAPGGTYRGAPVGSLGDIGTFSFFGNKNITTGEGGAVVTRRADLAEALRLTRSHGMTTMTWDRHQGHASTYDVVLPGMNYRFDEMRAALGLCQLQRLADNNTRRGNVVAAYRGALAKLREISVPFADRDESTYHLMVVVLPEGADRSRIIAQLRAAGIQTSVHYPPTHLFSAYRGSSPALPCIEALAPRLLTLPLYPAMTKDDVATVTTELAAALAAG